MSSSFPKQKPETIPGRKTRPNVTAWGISGFNNVFGLAVRIVIYINHEIYMYVNHY